MSKPQGLMAPPGGGDENKDPIEEIVTWLSLSLPCSQSLLRVFARFRLTRAPGWDDFWIVIALASFHPAHLSVVFNVTDLVTLAFQCRLHSLDRCRRTRRQWETYILLGTTTAVECHPMEQHCPNSWYHVLLNSKAGSRNSSHEAFEPN